MLKKKFKHTFELNSHSWYQEAKSLWIAEGRAMANELKHWEYVYNLPNAISLSTLKMWGFEDLCKCLTLRVCHLLLSDVTDFCELQVLN